MIQHNRLLYLLPFFLCAIALIWSVQHDPFFWDTVQLASKHAHHFYTNGLRWLPLPEEIDSGHPPVFGYYIACIWSVFGKNMPASHWAMLPFLLLNIWLLYLLGLRLGGQKWAFWLIPLVLLDPVMAGQSVLISPDLVLVCGFLFAVEGISGKNKFFTATGILLLCMISVRGMMTAGALAVWVGLMGLKVSGFKGFRVGRIVPSAFQFFINFVKPYLPFLPGFVFAAWFFWWHKQATGWIGLHPGSPWAPTFEPARGLELVRNLLVIGWRWLDFGRVFEWAILGWLLWKNRPATRKNVRLENRESLKSLLLLLICLIVLLSQSALFFKNVSAHRYFLPGFLTLHFIVFQTLVSVRSTVSNQWRNRNPATLAVMMSILILSLGLGNLWIYPRGIAMGWDSTLAHLPYHRIRAEAVAYLDENEIDFNTVGSAFPNLNTGENLMLNGDQRRFADQNLLQNDYFFASNVFNDISETDFGMLQRDWILVKKWQQSGVWIELYKRRY
ncbi:MAG TPA: hypothetical protein PK228_07520 [Saprospiraceae bacterium]|nr:hypothetical protein [Saprospiraceae bacterium]